MKFALIASSLIFTLAVRGAPPPNVAGMKFSRTVSDSFLINAIGTEFLLNANGTYSGLRRFDFRLMSVPGGTSGGVLRSVLVDVSIPQNGSWTYRVLDQGTAEIVLDGDILRLHFDDGKLSGHVGEPRPDTFAALFAFDVYNATTRLTNCSTRTFVAPGRSVSLGFVVTSGERRVLVRAVGPGLRTFGVADPLAQPRMEVFKSGSLLAVDLGLPVTSRATLEIAAQRAGAFPLPTASDVGKYLTLTEGAYIVEVRGSDSAASGEVLIEVYQLP